MKNALHSFLIFTVVFIAFAFCVTTCEAKEKQELKIIALAPHIVEMLFDIGAGENIVGTTQFSDHPEAAKKIPRVGNYAKLKIEEILALEPDMIIAWKTGNPSDDLERLQSFGIPIIYSDPTKLMDIAKELRHFGELTHTQALAEQRAEKFENDLNRLIKRYSTKEKVSVFYELWSKPITTVAKKAWPQQHLEVCGAYNPFKTLANDYPQINIEQIIIANPQLIIQPMSSGEPNPDAINWKKFNQVEASKNNQFLTPNSDILHRMSYRLLGELEQLCIGIDNTRTFYQGQ